MKPRYRPPFRALIPLRRKFFDRATAKTATIAEDDHGTELAVPLNASHSISAAQDTISSAVQRLYNCEITIFGAGSIGSYIMYFLAPALLIFNLFDPKSVDAHHTVAGRTMYGIDYIGQKKVEAAKHKIEREFAGAKVRPYPYNTGEVPDMELCDIFARSLVVIIAIDDPSQILRINRLAYSTVELIQAAAHRNATSGHIIYTLPCTSACLACCLGIHSASQMQRLDGEPALGWHIQRIAHEAAAIAMAIMLAKVHGTSITSFDTTKNLLYISNTCEEISPDGAGFRRERCMRQRSCPVCNVNILPQ